MVTIPMLGVLVKSPLIEDVAPSCKSIVAPSATFKLNSAPVPLPEPNEINGEVD